MIRRLLSLFLILNLLTPSVWAGADKTVDVIDEGAGRFRIDVPQTPADSGQGKKDALSPQGEWFFDEGGAGIGYLKVVIDTFPAEVYLDGQRLMISNEVQDFSVLPGKHFVSLFPPKQVYLAYREETPEIFWQKIAQKDFDTYRFGLIASYERDAVRTGTRWIQVTADDTVAVRLSLRDSGRVYRHSATTAAITFFSVAAVIAAAMFGSVALTARE